MSFYRTAWQSLSACVCLCLGIDVTAEAQPAPTPATQPAGERPPTPTITLQSISEDYSRQLRLIEKQRLERLAELAAHQPPSEAAETYETLFRLAITNNRFADAEPIAERLLASGTPLTPIVHLLARTVDLVGAADRGEYDASLNDLKLTVQLGAEVRKNESPAKRLLDTPALLVICDAYFQRLFQAGQFDIARKAAHIVIDHSKNQALRETCENHLSHLDLLAKPAPPIEGKDIDGTPFQLADLNGKPVLIVFWASWCLSNAQEVEWLDYVYNTYHAKGFQIVGINVDTMANSGTKPEAVLPDVKRFLLDHNVRWPNLINGTGAHDYAKAYHVTEIPASFLVGRDGKISHLHLSRRNLTTVIAQSVGP